MSLPLNHELQLSHPTLWKSFS